MADMLSKVKTSTSNSYTDIVEEARLLAYNDIPPYGFSLSSTPVVQRLTTLERLWVAGAQLTETEEAFWDACYERHYRPANYTARENYLALAAKDEVAKLAAEAAARMDEAAERAKTDAERSNDAILSAIDELEGMGLDQSDLDLAADLEKAMMEDWDYEAVQAASQPPAQESHFKRPPPSACTSTKRRAALQIGREMKRLRRGPLPAETLTISSAPTTTTETGSVAKPRSRKPQAIPMFTLTLRPKPSSSSKSTGIGARRPPGI